MTRYLSLQSPSVHRLRSLANWLCFCSSYERGFFLLFHCCFFHFQQLETAMKFLLAPCLLIVVATASTTSWACFITPADEQAPSTELSPAEYNKLPTPAPSPNQFNGVGGEWTCGHSLYWNVNESVGITNGVNAMENEFPWLVFFQLYVGNSVYRCGGAIINGMP